MEFTKEQFWFYTRRALWVMIAWVLISNTIFYFEYKTLLENNALASDFDFILSFTSYLLVSVIAGFLGGTITLNVMEWLVRKYAFWKAIVLIVVIYVFVAVVISFIGSRYYFSDYTGADALSSEVTRASQNFFSSWMFIKNMIIWLFIVLGTLIVLMINDKFGPGVFPDYLKGKYFHPKREERVFMFADIRDATTIAEKIGEEKYFSFLKDFFGHIAPAIQKTYGEVYQYVGDEVVITWKLGKGLKNANTVQCFFRMQKAVQKHKIYYLEKYGYLPEFKAGIHCGYVMVGELGKIKRDIAFSGDVLNTTARIQAQCNKKGVNILLSEEFACKNYNLPANKKLKALGTEQLKGKKEEVALMTIERV